MKKLLSNILIFVLLLEAFYIPAVAYNRDDHDYYTEEVLFGEYHSSALNKKQREAIDLLNCALYLTIDQFNGTGEKELSTLKAAGVKNLPELAEIDFNANYKHRSYTHRGWDYNYPDDRAHWKVRKEILRSTAKKVFPGFANDKQCDAFCALLYYIHIIADGMAEKSYKKSDLRIPVGGRAGRDNLDAIQEILRILPLVFPSQTNDHLYERLKVELASLDNKMTELTTSTGGINTDEEFIEYHGYTEKAMEILHARIYRLLQEEPFFCSVFPEV